MSVLFTTSEVTLAKLVLAYHREQFGGKRQLDVVVRCLGLATPPKRCCRTIL